jgi:hypothetical protein
MKRPGAILRMILNAGLAQIASAVKGPVAEPLPKGLHFLYATSYLNQHGVLNLSARKCVQF